ncbi:MULTISPECIES: helix-turn-helix transcriptional regulator [unclassified Streptomyces]|uniref:helix-turn-helix domain-containing protein n=1 Tax=unclassified Streptomyces TaxID=2593676 RepID=UPI0001C1BAEB|nr:MULTISPECIES: helix-turn-helix transcriptional regulator [unclassified Streptomyces]MYR65868.1 helix-turn-helix domain-containing protein [Streptomyces sp. SID4939]MYS02197.1 helix-turn-helix domain-containing protein [Streptomyces sp. SID4940]MYT85881.1 helix-turn-helix domain-containing protein [Streptomyces sp. SID8360]MYW38568.1 helix-turn-helix domain-containing protein [Streptomyces sp. SID1]AEN11103.1 helix-turn-helix domain protein [Streptomyces sp. SirexAA-E]
MNGATRQGNRSSTVLARRLGSELLRLRDASGKTQQEAAQVISATNSKIVKMERGWVPMRDPDIRTLCEFYGVDDAKLVGRLLEVARLDRERRKAKGWWNQYPELRSLVEYVALEDIATAVRTWQVAFVPGLLQTPDYARALAVGNAEWDDPEEIERFVEAKIARQARLGDANPLALWAIVGEGALRQLVGGREVMRAQLARLIEAAAEPNVTVQVVPFLAGSHPGMTSAFSVVSFAEPGALDVVYMDTTSSTLWLESETDAARHNVTFGRIARSGLAPRDSIALMERIRKEL